MNTITRWVLVLGFAMSAVGCAAREDAADEAATDDGAANELNLLKRMEWRFQGTLPKGFGVLMMPNAEGGIVPFHHSRGEEIELLGPFDQKVAGESWGLDGRWRTKRISMVVSAAGQHVELGWLTFFSPFFDGYEWQSAEEARKMTVEMIPIPSNGVLKIRIAKAADGSYAFLPVDGANAAQAPTVSGAKSYLSFRLPRASVALKVVIEPAADVAAEVSRAFDAGKRPPGVERSGE